MNRIYAILIILTLIFILEGVSHVVDKQRLLWIKQEYGPYIKKAASRYGIPENLIAAIIYTESGGNPLTQGRYGDKGLMQITDTAIRDLGYNPEEVNLFDPETNIMFGTAYLARLKYVYGLDTWEKVIRGYNGGPDGYKEPQTLSYYHRVMAAWRALNG